MRAEEGVRLSHTWLLPTRARFMQCHCDCVGTSPPGPCLPRPPHSGPATARLSSGVCFFARLLNHLFQGSTLFPLCASGIVFPVLSSCGWQSESADQPTPCPRNLRWGHVTRRGLQAAGPKVGTRRSRSGRGLDPCVVQCDGQGPST